MKLKNYFEDGTFSYGIAKVLLVKKSWNSDPIIIEYSKKIIILLWAFYFMAQFIISEDLFIDFRSYWLEFFSSDWIKFFLNYLPDFNSLLFGLTTYYLVLSIIYFIARKLIRYTEYINGQPIFIDFFSLHCPRAPFTPELARSLKSFLNASPSLGKNIYWLDGSWGSGKTAFIRHFFKEQWLRRDTIYYISCFGIRTREQAEQLLLSEVEKHSSFSSLEYIPIVNGLVKLIFKLLGLNLMKKDAVVIFDDLERVTYAEIGQDNPQNYNDLLGFIDYLANYQNKKVIVVYNSQELQQTQLAIIDAKFKPVVHRSLSSRHDIHNMLDNHVFGKSREYLRGFYEEVFNLVLRNYDYFNLRVLIKFLNLASKLHVSDIVGHMIETNLLNFPESVGDFPFIEFDSSERDNLSARYLLLMLEMTQRVEKIDNTGGYKIYDKVFVGTPYYSDNGLDYDKLYEIVTNYEESNYVRGTAEEYALLKLYDGQEGLSVRKLEFTVGNLVFMFNFLQPKQVLNEVSLAEHMKNHFKVEAVPDQAVVYKLTEDFQTVFQSFSHKNARHHVKYLEEWQEVLLELKTELESGPYYNLFKISALDWPAAENKTHLYHMPQGLFEEWDKRNNILNS